MDFRRQLTSVGVACFLALPIEILAENIDPRLAKENICGPFEVVHVNGVDTTLAGARDNTNALAAAYGNAHEGHLVAYGLAYNATSNLAYDVADAFQQIVLDYPGVKYRDWLRAVTRGILGDSVTVELIAEITGRLGEALGLRRPDAFYDADLALMIASIKSFHHRSGRLLLVPHSQGNLYANLLHDRLVAGTGSPTFSIAAQSINIMGVAAPVVSLRGNGGYVTSKGDKVIDGVRLVFPDTLPANSKAPSIAADLKGHSFSEVYLSQLSPTRAEIAKKMEHALSGLKGASPFTYQGTPVESITLSGVASWQDCGPGPGQPLPCYTFAGTFFEPIVTYTVPFLGGQVRPGTISEIEELATSKVRGCFAALVDAWKLNALVPDSQKQLINVPGCGGVSYASEDLIAWIIHSSDKMKMSVEFPYSNQAQARGAAFCRK